MRTFIVILIIWILNALTDAADYRFKRRGPVGPPRAPPPSPPAYLKKWQTGRPLRGPSRPPRPIPVQNQASFGTAPLPVGPLKTTHHTPNRVIQKPTKTLYKKVSTKPFQSSRPLNFKPDLDYHIQTNNIPNSIPIQNKVIDVSNNIPIKQTDEKGPIRTIPAPNLSRDKPRETEELIRDSRPSQENQRPFLQQSHHQYQVIEAEDNLNKNKQSQRTFLESSYLPNNFQKQQQQQQFLQNQPYLVPSNIFDAIPVEHSIPLPPQGPPQAQDLQKLSSYIHDQQALQLSTKNSANTKDLQQLINVYSQEQPAARPSIGKYFGNNYAQAQAAQKVKLQPQLHIPDYQTMLQQAQVFQPEPAYLAQIQRAIGQNTNEKLKVQTGQNANEKFKVQLHNFNYEDQISNFRDGSSSSSIKFPKYETLENKQETSLASRSNLNISPQNSYLKHIIDAVDESAENHQNKRSDTLPPESFSQLDDKDQLSNFYLTLPNKEAAEALAKLQEAGKINSNLMKMEPQNVQNLQLRPKNPLTIYVSDEQDSTEDEANDTEDVYENFKNQQEFMDEENQVDENQVRDENDNKKLQGRKKENDAATFRDNKSFGSKIKPKTS